MFNSETTGLRCLLFIDQTERTNKLVHFAANLRKALADAIVLSVREGRPLKTDSHSELIFEDEVASDSATRAVNDVSKRLGNCDIACVPTVKTGEPLRVILECAVEYECDLIVLANPRKGLIRGFLNYAGVPVTSRLVSGVIAATSLPVLVVN